MAADPGDASSAGSKGTATSATGPIGAGQSPAPGPRSWSGFALLCALLAAAAAAASLAPVDFPAWPAATLGILGLALSTRPGSALGRAISAFLSLAALLVGTAQIALMYGAAFVLD